MPMAADEKTLPRPLRHATNGWQRTFHFSKLKYARLGPRSRRLSHSR